MSLSFTNLKLNLGHKTYDYEADLSLCFTPPETVILKKEFITILSEFGEDKFIVKAKTKDASTFLQPFQVRLSPSTVAAELTKTEFIVKFALYVTKLPSRELKKPERVETLKILPNEARKSYELTFGEIGTLTFDLIGLTREEFETKEKERRRKAIEEMKRKMRQEKEDAEESERYTLYDVEESQFHSILKLFRSSATHATSIAEKRFDLKSDSDDDDDDENNGADENGEGNSNSNILADDLEKREQKRKRKAAAARNFAVHLGKFAKKFHKLCFQPNKKHLFCDALFFTNNDSSAFMDLEPITLRKINFERMNHCLGDETTILNFEQVAVTKLVAGQNSKKNNDDDYDDELETDGWVVVPPPPRPQDFESSMTLNEFLNSKDRFGKFDQENNSNHYNNVNNRKRRNTTTTSAKENEQQDNKMKPFHVFVEASPGQGKTVLAKELCRRQPWAPEAIALYLPLEVILAEGKEIDNLTQLLKITLASAFLKGSTCGIEDVVRLMKIVDDIDEHEDLAAKFGAKSKCTHQHHHHASSDTDDENVTCEKDTDGMLTQDTSNPFELEANDLITKRKLRAMRHTAQHEEDADAEIRTNIDGSTLHHLITNACEKIIQCAIPIVWVLDNLDAVDRFDNKTHVHRFLEEFVSPAGRHSSSTAAIARLTSSPIRQMDSVFCFTRDERKRDSCIFYDSINPVSVYVLERWHKEACKDAFHNLVSARLPESISEAEVSQLVQFVAEANESFFGQEKTEEAASRKFNEERASKKPKATAASSAEAASLFPKTNSFSSLWTGTPFVINLLSIYVHDVMTGVPNRQTRQNLLTEAIADSPIRLFEFFVSLRLNLLLKDHNCFSPEHPESKRVLNEAGKMAIRLLMQLAEEGEGIRFKADCGLGFSAIEWLGDEILRSFAQKNNNNCSGAFMSTAEIVAKRKRGLTLASLAASFSNSFATSSPQQSASFANLEKTDENTFIDHKDEIQRARAAIFKNPMFAFSNHGDDNRIPTPSWAEILSAAGLLLKKEPLLVCSSSPPQPSSPLRSAAVSGSATPADQGDLASAQNNNNNAAAADDALLSAFPSYSFRNRLDVELFAAAFLVRNGGSDFTKLAEIALPWSPCFRVLWTAISAHVVSLLNYKTRSSSASNCNASVVAAAYAFPVQTLVDVVAKKYYYAYHQYREHVDGLLLHQKRERLHNVAELDKHQNAIAPSLLIEITTIVPPALVFEAIMKHHGILVLHLPAHLFWLGDVCGKFGNFVALDWLLKKYSSNKDLQRRGLCDQIWKRMVFNAFCSSSLNDADVFNILNIATAHVPSLQAIEVFAERIVLEM